MKDEVKSAVDFLTNILRGGDNINEAQSKHFSASLINLLCVRYEEHWFPEKPMKGSGYRCIRLNHKIDPVILQAGQMCGLDSTFLMATFPPELTIWVDPRDVSFRIGENGSVGVLFPSETKKEPVQPRYTQRTPSPQQPRFTQRTPSPQVIDNVMNNNSSNLNSQYNMSCKGQYMNSFPSSMEWEHPVNYQHLAGFVSS